MSITVIGDVHGRRNEYCAIMDKNEYTVQIGDCDFEYSHLKDYDPNKHKLIPGNHDNHETVYNDPHCLGRFGYTSLNGVSFFFVAGAFSIDRMYRKENVDWFSNEELSYKEMWDAITLYEEVRPEIVISHDCPDIITKSYYGIFDKNNTRIGLERMFEFHKPKMWIYGHWHRNTRYNVLGTEFICLNELRTFSVG